MKFREVSTLQHKISLKNVLIGAVSMKFCEVSTLQRKISLKTALIGAVSMKFREVSTLLQTPPNIFTLAVLKFQLSGVAGSGYRDSSCSPVHSSSEG